LFLDEVVCKRRVLVKVRKGKGKGRKMKKEELKLLAEEAELRRQDELQCQALGIPTPPPDDREQDEDAAPPTDENGELLLDPAMPIEDLDAAGTPLQAGSVEGWVSSIIDLWTEQVCYHPYFTSFCLLNC
jgi:hypothetical protein